ncbi:hypothetical protein PoMZ_13069 [Pyricularia oryzae]|uniref:Uncharacterized protein n=1 Tax=Pyricularia oryzae TaxID=318829 RepID=A0A4P7NUJ5_PYROR|nr:hypothetical protein PoMZ_13069 [Pyricularia oryzae]
MDKGTWRLLQRLLMWLPRRVRHSRKASRQFDAFL